MDSTWITNLSSFDSAIKLKNSFESINCQDSGVFFPLEMIALKHNLILKWWSLNNSLAAFTSYREDTYGFNRFSIWDINVTLEFSDKEHWCLKFFFASSFCPLWKGFFVALIYCLVFFLFFTFIHYYFIPNDKYLFSISIILPSFFKKPVKPALLLVDS